MSNRLSKSRLPGNGFSFKQKILSENAGYHWHEFYEIEYILDGEANYISDGIPFHMKRGSLTFLTPSDYHEVQLLTDEISVINLMFTDEWIDDYLIKQLDYPTILHDYEFFPTEKLSLEFSGNCAYNTEYIRYILNAILIDILRNIKNAPFRLYSEPIHNALSYIHRNLRDGITLEKAAAQAGFTPNYFSKMFHESVGQSFVNYVSDLKLSLASSLLTHSSLPITEICFKSGFNSFSHFQLCFKRKYAISPIRYRKAAQQGKNSITAALP